jgi:hypothetical protein
MDGQTPQPVVDDDTRARLTVIADLLVPAGDGMPGAADIDVTGKWLDRVTAADPSLVAPLVALGACASWEDLEALHERDPETFERAAFALVSAYYLHPGVRRRMGYPGQGPSPILSDETEWYLRDGLLDAVRDRGPVYVPTPDG